jgi:2-haloacid dehalogenase
VTPGSVGAASVGAVFVDVFGTLLSLAPLVDVCEELVPGRAAEVAARWRARQVEATWLRTAMGSWTDFEKVTAQVLAVALEDVVGPEAAARVRVSDRRRLAGAFEGLPVADGAREALASLRAAGVATGVLSNGSAGQLRRIVARNALDDVLDHVLSVDAVRVYKPDPRVYMLAVDAAGLPVERIGFVTANGWDAAGGGAFGFRVAWLRGEGSPPMPSVGAPRPIETDWPGVPAVFLGG